MLIFPLVASGFCDFLRKALPDSRIEKKKKSAMIFPNTLVVFLVMSDSLVLPVSQQISGKISGVHRVPIKGTGE